MGAAVPGFCNDCMDYCHGVSMAEPGLCLKHGFKLLLAGLPKFP
jgi:hypothetical protein